MSINPNYQYLPPKHLIYGTETVSKMTLFVWSKLTFVKTTFVKRKGNSLTTGQTPCANEDNVIWSKAPEQLLNGPSGEIVFSTSEYNKPQLNISFRLEDTVLFVLLLLLNPQLCRSCKGHVALKMAVQTHAWVLGSVLGQQTARPGRVHVINFLQPPSGSFIGLGQIKLWQKPYSVVTTNVCHMSGTTRWHSVMLFSLFISNIT